MKIVCVCHISAIWLFELKQIKNTKIMNAVEPIQLTILLSIIGLADIGNVVYK